MISMMVTAFLYPTILGPDFWGLVSKHWKLCASGQMQSPINIDPNTLLFDGNLPSIHLESIQVYIIYFLYYYLIFIG